jgi:hypothetical protein
LQGREEARIKVETKDRWYNVPNNYSVRQQLLLQSTGAG